MLCYLCAIIGNVKNTYAGLSINKMADVANKLICHSEKHRELKLLKKVLPNRIQGSRHSYCERIS